MAAEKEPVTSTDTSTEGTTTKDPDLSDGITISKATLVVKDKAGNVGIVNGLTNNDITKLSDTITMVQNHENSITNLSTDLTSKINSEANTRATADTNLKKSITTNTSNISTLTTNLNTEISDRKSAINTLTATVTDNKTATDKSIATINSSMVNLTTDQTITGTKRFQDIHFKKSNIDTLNPPTSSTTWNTTEFCDKNGRRLVGLAVGHYSDGSISFNMGTSKYIDSTTAYTNLGGVSIVGYNDKTSKLNISTTNAYAPTPSTSSNSTNIATTAWVNTKINSAKVENNSYSEFKVKCQALDIVSTALDETATTATWADLRFYGKKGTRMGYLGMQTTTSGEYTSSFGINRVFSGSTEMQYFNLWNISVDKNKRFLVRIPHIVPVGTILAWSVANKIPAGFLYCNGTAISRTTYVDLFNTIGTTWGSGDNSTTFNIPDLRGRFLEGTTVGKYISAGLPNITGHFGTGGSTPMLWREHTGGAFTNGATFNVEFFGNKNSGNGRTDYLTFYASNSNSIYGSSSTVQPPAAGVDFIIKY